MRNYDDGQPITTIRELADKVAKMEAAGFPPEESRIRAIIKSDWSLVVGGAAAIWVVVVQIILPLNRLQVQMAAVAEQQSEETMSYQQFIRDHATFGEQQKSQDAATAANTDAIKAIDVRLQRRGI